MGALGNLDHERFCQALHKRLWAGSKRSQALALTYRETMYSGTNADDAAIKPNARRLANSKRIAARLKELNDYAAKLSGLDAGWALLQLHQVVTEAQAYTLDHYIARNEDGTRRPEFDISIVPDERIARLTEMTTETIITRDADGNETVRRKIKIKGPDKFSVIPTTIDKMAALAGWKAPTKIAPTNVAGDDLTLEALVMASLAPAREVAA